MRNFLTKGISTALDWIYPPTCIACRSLLPLNFPERFICEACMRLFETVVPPICKQCGVTVSGDTPLCASCYGKNFHFTYNRATFPYDEVIRDMMHEIKFRKKKRVAQGLGELWAASVVKKSFPQDGILVPVPMHPAKKRERGFNQAEVLCRALSQKFNIPMDELLIRTADTPPQAGLHPKLRVENVQGVFSVRPHADIKGSTYIIIDDIYTTGASLNECAKTIKNSGAKQILCMTFAITVKNNDKV